jgi:hypothetical protein
VQFPHWQHFLSLEKDFFDSIEFVEIDPANNSTFSVVYTKLFLATCSEIDVVSKLVCKKINETSTARNIHHYRAEITAQYPNIYAVECLMPRYGLVFKPWSQWSNDTNPSWWQEHNDVKHQRDRYSQRANQKNVMESLSGLFCMLLYLYQSELYSGELLPSPMLWEYHNMPCGVTVNLGAELPDIPRQDA